VNGDDLPHQSAKATKQLKDLEMGMMVCAHKFGIIYCKDGQISEDEMLNNGAAFPSLSLAGVTPARGWRRHRDAHKARVCGYVDVNRGG
jgi:hypothetical protein